jgi:cephalosporin hydroxylase
MSVYYDLDPDGLKIKNFEHIINTYGYPNIVVEIGCYYGKTTSELVQRIAPRNPNLTYYAIDPFDTSIDVGEDLEMIHDMFMKNLESFPFKNNIVFYREKSFDGLVKLRNDKVAPQLIYIDGDHTASTVLNDLVLSFDILATGGMIVCDDSVVWKYKDKNGTEDPQMSPRMAVETFLMCNWSKINLLHLPNGYQTAFIKK